MKKLTVLPFILLFFVHGHAQTPVALTVSAGVDQVVCPGTSIHLTTFTNGGDGNYKFSWSPAEGLSDSTMPDPMAQPVNTTTYVLTVTDLSGNTATDTLLITVDQPSGVVTSSGNQLICGGDSLQLTVQTDPANTIFWNTGDQTSNIWVKESGDYYAMITSPSGCMMPADNDIWVTALSLPETPELIANGSTELCAGQTLTLSGRNTTGLTDYFWSTGDIDTSITVSDSGTYSLQLRDWYGCPSQAATVKVNVHPLPSAIIVANGSTTICAGDSLQLSVNSPDQLSFAWSTGATTPSIFAKQASSFSLHVKSEYGCENDASNIITTTIKPVTVPVITQSGNKLSVATSSTFYQWYLNDQQLQDKNTPVIQMEKGGVYSVRVNYNGCPSMASINGILRIVEPQAEYQVYPNPVDQDLHIFYALPADEKVTITLHDVMGKRIALFADHEWQTEGSHEYHFSRSHKAIMKGIYTLTLEIGNKRYVRQILFR